MVANCDRTRPLARRLLAGASAFALAFSLSAAAQTSSTSGTPMALSDSPSYSSSSLPVSTDYQAYLNADGLLGGKSLSALQPAFGIAGPSPAPQYGHRRYPQYPNYQSRTSHIAFVAGGGFTAPIGNATNGYETWGYNLDVGGGWNFTKRFGALFEYQFDRNKIPGATISQVGAQGGNINSHLFLFNAIAYLMPQSKLGMYVTGGGGISRKVTNFTDLVPQQYCYYYFCSYGYAPVTVASFSSVQGAADLGIGFDWKAFGPDSNGKLFAEARYIFVNSPGPTATTEGEGTEEIIPVTFGVRW